ncbi:MAG: nucleotide pyrophosphohydrolase [Pirellulaceae bacterium]|nr:nucleotide pyrophosphohydrolase [Pirellulaceae bacterium]
MNDAGTTIAELKRILGEFVDQRDWRQFHSPKNLAMSLAIEAAELMEHFQWLDVSDSRAVVHQPERKQAIAEEIADVLCYTLAIANSLELDLAAAFEHKMAKNRLKYPADEFRGRWGRDQVPTREPASTAESVAAEHQ